MGTSREEAEGYMMQHIGFEAEANVKLIRNFRLNYQLSFLAIF